MIVKPRATIDDLYRVKGKAELVDGEIVLMPPTGEGPSSAAGNIFASLLAYGRTTGRGRAYTDNLGYHVDLPNRESFSPDVSFHIGPRSGMKFIEGAPIFAVEVRSEGDYGSAADRQIQRKREDYFAAGTEVVWDVDLLGPQAIRKYTKTSPNNPVVYRRGEQADAEPALPGWSFPVDELYG